MRHECNLFKVEKKDSNQANRSQKNNKKASKERDRNAYDDWNEDYRRWSEEENEAW